MYCSVDDEISGHDAIKTSCGDCGESFASLEALQRHQQNSRHTTQFPKQTSRHNHLRQRTSNQPAETARSEQKTATTEAQKLSHRQAIAQWLVDSDLEVLCFVEGMDPLTSDTVQALHSYVHTCFERQYLIEGSAAMHMYLGFHSVQVHDFRHGLGYAICFLSTDSCRQEP